MCSGSICEATNWTWNDWEPWGQCSTTCDAGFQRRHRSCSNSETISAVTSCSGDNVEYKLCSERVCKAANGTWADWESWGPCSVSCDAGLQRRQRSCSALNDSLSEQNCLGSPTEYKVCIGRLCAVHGGWTEWSPWEACSVTCDIGIQRRHRDCSNPIPKHSGLNCLGDTMDVAVCLPGPCANGGWSVWNAWTGCSVTCGAGIKSRSRTCTNPRPSVLGQQCEGDSLQDDTCVMNSCVQPTIAFRTNTLQNISLGFRGNFVFTTVTLNAGGGYNSSTGIFTAPIAGTYFISTQICVGATPDDWTYFDIVQNGQPIARTFARGNNVDVASFNADVVAVLSLNDRVWVEHTVGSGVLYQSSTLWNMFYGYLQQ